MNERILNLLSLCMQAKEKGIDAFFNYSPHVNSVNIYVHSPHWISPQKDENGEPIVGTDNLVWKTCFYISAENHCEIDDVKLSEAEAYLKGLVEA